MSGLIPQLSYIINISFSSPYPALLLSAVPPLLPAESESARTIPWNCVERVNPEVAT